jgi:exosortase A
VLRSSDLPVQTTSAWATTRWALGIGLAALLVVFAPTWIAMAKVWANSETYGHGMAVAPIAVWLVWRQRTQLAALTPSVSWVGVAGLAVCCVGWLAAELAGINVVTQFAFTGMIVCLVLALTGWSVAKAMAFPLLFLFFMVPAGEVFNPPLMDGTANATVWALQFSGIPVYREGMNFALPTGRWSVVEACSGLRYVLAAAMLGALFAYLNFARWTQRVIFFGVSILVAVVANWMRAYLIVLMGHFSNMKWGVGDDHVVYGWVFFGITMFVLFWMGAKWRDAATASTLKESNAEPTNNKLILKKQPPTLGRISIALFVSFSVISVGWSASIHLKKQTQLADYSQRVQVAIGEINKIELTIHANYKGAREVVQGVMKMLPAIEIHGAYYANQTPGHEMVSSHRLLDLDGITGVRVLSRKIRKLSIGTGNATVQEFIVSGPAGDRLVWFWYVIGGHITVSESRAKILTALEMMRGRGDHSMVTLVSMPIELTNRNGMPGIDSQLELKRDVLLDIVKRLRFEVP